MSAIQAEIARLEELSVADLVARYVEVYGREPRSKNRRFLERRIAFKVAEAASGGLSEVARKRLAELMAAIELPTWRPQATPTRLVPRAKQNAPAVGATLTRAWHGRQVVVQVREDGIEYEGKIFKSLTAVASHVTGSHWNGRLFFGLSSRKPA